MAKQQPYKACLNFAAHPIHLKAADCRIEVEVASAQPVVRCDIIVKTLLDNLFAFADCLTCENLHLSSREDKVGPGGKLRPVGRTYSAPLPLTNPSFLPATDSSVTNEQSAPFGGVFQSYPSTDLQDSLRQQIRSNAIQKSKEKDKKANAVSLIHIRKEVYRVRKQSDLQRGRLIPLFWHIYSLVYYEGSSGQNIMRYFTIKSRSIFLGKLKIGPRILRLLKFQ